MERLHKFINNILNSKTLNNQHDKTINYNLYDNLKSKCEILPYRVFDSENDLYINANSISFILEVNPLVGGNEQTSKILTDMITDGLPENCVMSFINWASPNIQHILDNWCEPRFNNGEIYKKQAIERSKFVKNGTVNSIFTSAPFTIKDFRCFITATLNFKNRSDIAAISKELIDFRKRLIGTLKNIGMLTTYKSFTPECLINLLNEILNLSNKDQSFDKINYKPTENINSQICNPENPLIVRNDGLLFEKENIVAKVFSVKDYPDFWAQWQGSELIGSMESDFLKMTCPFLTCFSILVENEEKNKRKATIKSTRLTQQSGTQMAKFMPWLKTQKADWDFVMEKLNSGSQKLVKSSYSIVIFDNEDKIKESEQTIKSIYKKNGWVLKLDKYIQLATFMASLPFILGDGLVPTFNKFEKWKTMVSWTCANILPIQGEWKGNSNSGVLLFGRRGQPFMWNPFCNKGGNYNVAVVGKSGSGKSVFMQELVSSLRGNGAQVFVIDDGRSFMNTCLLQGGKFIAFGNNTNICLNPFSMINEEEFDKIDSNGNKNSDYRTENINLIKNIIITMCFQVETPTDIIEKIIENSITAVWDKYKTNSTITDIQHYFEDKSQLEIEKEFALQYKKISMLLSPYCNGGKYESYFNGKSNLEINNNFISFEMAELKARKDLRQIVLLILMYIISEKMYFGNRKQNIALVIDEAWDLLGGGGAMHDFIEGFVRRCRKYKGALITGTQSVNDYFKNDGAKSAFENSDWTCSLAQKEESINDFERSGKMVMTEGKKELLKSLKMSDKEYSEIMINNSDGFAIGRLILDRYSLSMYSSKAEDFDRIQELCKKGHSLAEAIEISSNSVR